MIKKTATIIQEYSDLLNVLKLIDYNDKYQLLYFKNRYFE